MHKNPQPHFPLWKSIQHIYETHEILRSMIFSTVSCLESDNDVSTSNTNGDTMLQSFVSKVLKKTAEDTLVPPLWENGKLSACLLNFICSRGCARLHAAELVYSRFYLENCQHADLKQLTR